MRYARAGSNKRIRKKNKGSGKYKAGYMQGCEDMLRNFQEYLMSQERELKR